uniref:Cadherin EGF LAG seven-pass G-type receptor 1 n=1 Tax=Lygus hesperus TaxID=30085 RepID=A0A146L4Q3_LYGHE
MLHSKSPIYFTALLFLSLLYFACDGCEQDELVRGCRISQGRCLCGVGCDTEYRYSSRDECRDALKGRSQDACSMNPCHNDGACIQTASSYANFKCKCEGTGFYGPKCQYPCPSSGSAAAKNFPYECIEI